MDPLSDNFSNATTRTASAKTSKDEQIGLHDESTATAVGDRPSKPEDLGKTSVFTSICNVVEWILVLVPALFIGILAIR
jgi:hypothetical protein